jgi:hypothetical protein
MLRDAGVAALRTFKRRRDALAPATALFLAALMFQELFRGFAKTTLFGDDSELTDPAAAAVVRTHPFTRRSLD